MRSFLYEFLNRIKAKNAVIFTVLLTALLIALVYSSYSSISSPGQFQPPDKITGALFSDSGTYYFDTYVFNSSTGNPAINTVVNFTLYNPTTGIIINFQHETNSQGYSNISIDNVSDQSYCLVEANTGNGYTNGNPFHKPGGLTLPVQSATPYGESLTQVCYIFGSSKLAPQSILVVSFNATGTPGRNLMVYYNYSCNTTGYSQIDNYDILGAVYTNFSVVKFTPKISEQYYYTNVYFEVDGRQVYDFATFSVTSSPAGQLESTFNFEYAAVAFLMGTLGISLAYFSYNKDRVSGAYQELIVRPNTRTGLMTSRFLSVSFLLLVSSSLIGLGTYIITVLLYSFYLPSSFILYITFSSYVLSDAMASISFLIGTRTKSAGAVIAIPIVIFILLILFVPSIVPPILSKLGILAGTRSYNLITLLVSLFDPASSFSVIGSSLFRPIMASSSLYIAGAVLWIAIVYSVLWIIVPYVGNYFLSKITD